MSTDGTGRQSPLSAFFATAAGDPADGAAVVISERPFLGHLNLRGDPGDGGFTSAAAGVLGFSTADGAQHDGREGRSARAVAGARRVARRHAPGRSDLGLRTPSKPRSRASTPRSPT